MSDLIPKARVAPPCDQDQHPPSNGIALPEYTDGGDIHVRIPGRDPQAAPQPDSNHSSATVL